MLRYKVMSMTEFYNADIFDLNLCTANLEQAEREAYEKTRLMMWAALSPYSKKKIAPTEVLKFSWDNEDDGNHAAPLTDEQFEQQKNKILSILNR